MIGEFIADVSKVQTSNEKKLEEALRAAEEAKQRYNNNDNNNYNNNNSQNSDQSYNTEEPGGTTDSNYNTDSNGNYKSNELNNGTEEEESEGGFLNSLLGGMSSGSNGN